MAQTQNIAVQEAEIPPFRIENVMTFNTFQVRDELCVVLGVNGQDGSYVTEYLLARGKKVVGIGKQAQSVWVKKHKNYDYVSLDLLNIDLFLQVLIGLRPSLIFNTAAVHGSSNFNYESVWKEAHTINTLLTHGILDYIRNSNIDCSYLFLSSGKAFGTDLPTLIDDRTPTRGTCIYTITKNAASDLIRFYRSNHGVKAKVVWTFNHESSRRPCDYFIPKVIDVLAKSLHNIEYRGHVHTLDFWCDWGDAEEYMKICSMFALQNTDNDLVLATGKTLWARDFVKQLFTKYSLNYKDHLIENSLKCVHRPKIEPWRVDVSPISIYLGMTPQVSIFQVCSQILETKYFVKI